MDSYVIHIYRRSHDDPHGIVGTVEVAGVKKPQTFHSLREICDILTAPRGRLRRKRQAGPAPPGRQTVDQ